MSHVISRHVLKRSHQSAMRMGSSAVVAHDLTRRRSGRCVGESRLPAFRFCHGGVVLGWCSSIGCAASPPPVPSGSGV
jgi:hypothetical protein